VGPAARAMRAAEVVTFALVRSLAVPALAVPLVTGAAATAQRVSWRFSAKTMAVVRRAGLSRPPESRQLSPGWPPPPPPPPPAARIATLLQKQFDNREPVHIYQPDRRRWRCGGQRGVGLRDELEKGSSCWEAGAGRFRSSRFAALPQNSGLRRGLHGRLAPAVAAGIQRGGESFSAAI